MGKNAVNDIHQLDFCIAISISGFIIQTFLASKSHSKIMKTMGRGSMVPYVLHAHLTIPILVILQKCPDFAVYVIAETIVAVLLSLIVINLMERFKWIKAFLSNCNFGTALGVKKAYDIKRIMP